MFLNGIQNIGPGYIPILVVDLCSFGIISTAYMVKNIDPFKLKRIGLFLFFVPISYYAITVPQLNLQLLTLGSFKRELAVSTISEQILAGGASKSYVVYMTQQLMGVYLNLFLLLLPLYYKFFKRRTVMVMIFLSISAIVLIASYYQKKQGITELFLILMLYLLFYRGSLKELLTRNVVISLGIISAILAGLLSFTFIEGLIFRFKDLAENISEFDRLEETKFAFSNFKIIDFLFGKGLGSYVDNTAGYSMLHIGYSNFILKGGIVLLVMYLFNTLTNIAYCIRNKKKSPIFNVGIAISVFSLIQLTYTGGYHFYAPVILTGLAMFSRYPLRMIHTKML